MLYTRKKFLLVIPFAFFAVLSLSNYAQDQRTSKENLPRSNTLNIVSIFLGRSGYEPAVSHLYIGSGDKVEPGLKAELTEGQRKSAVLILAEQADLSGADYITDHDERGWFVYNTLTRHAAQSQKSLANFLQRSGVSYQSYWAANMIVAEIDENLADSLAKRPDVARINSNRPQRWIEPPEILKPSALPDESAAVPNNVEWGVAKVNAPAVWTLGYTGQGMVVGDLDTGVRWTHSTLISKYRGWNGSTADHNYNWLDAVHSGGGICGSDTMAPCDDHGHGTHTTGTIVGDDGAGNQIGVAPGAKWIGCRNMDQGNGTPATYTECFQFMIAPTDLSGNNPDPTLRPHILNNSWACPVSEGCTTGAELETIINNAQAAGIFIVASAGNSGPGCSSVSSSPATYNSSFTVGSINSSDQLANGSSRGPSLYYDPSLLKPDISAPGVGVRSAIASTDSSFSTLNGTSMAGPHVAGVIALLWSANPELVRDIETTKNILRSTANPDVTLITPQTCGGTPSTQLPNNSFGYGRVDALAALNAAPPPPFEVAGRALSPSGQGVNGGRVTLTDATGLSRFVMTNSLGYFQFDEISALGTYLLRVHSKRYRFESRTVSASDDDLTELEFLGLE